MSNKICNIYNTKGWNLEYIVFWSFVAKLKVISTKTLKFKKFYSYYLKQTCNLDIRKLLGTHYRHICACFYCSVITRKINICKIKNSTFDIMWLLFCNIWFLLYYKIRLYIPSFSADDLTESWLWVPDVDKSLSFSKVVLHLALHVLVIKLLLQLMK